MVLDVNATADYLNVNIFAVAILPDEFFDGFWRIYNKIKHVTKGITKFLMKYSLLDTPRTIYKALKKSLFSVLDSLISIIKDYKTRTLFYFLDF